MASDAGNEWASVAEMMEPLSDDKPPTTPLRRSALTDHLIALTSERDRYREALERIAKADTGSSVVAAAMRLVARAALDEAQ